jgi:hypothetical protein
MKILTHKIYKNINTLPEVSHEFRFCKILGCLLYNNSQRYRYYDNIKLKDNIRRYRQFCSMWSKLPLMDIMFVLKNL